MTRTHATRISTLGIALALLVSPASALADPATSTVPPAGNVPVLTPTDPEVPAPRPAPVLVVRSYDTSTDRIVVGSAFTLTLEVYNATARRAENVVVSLGASATGGMPDAAATGGLTVLGTGNAKFLGALKGQRAETIDFEVMAGPGTPPGTATVPVTVSFEYDGVRQEVGYTIGLLIERDASFALVSAELPDSIMTGESFDAMFEVANTGGFAVSGVTLSVEASGATVVDGTLFLGTFDVAGTETIDVTIVPEGPGTLEVAVVVSYRDDLGRAQSFRETKSVTVEDVPDDGPAGPDQPDPEKESNDNWFVALIKALFGIGD